MERAPRQLVRLAVAVAVVSASSCSTGDNVATSEHNVLQQSLVIADELGVPVDDIDSGRLAELTSIDPELQRSVEGALERHIPDTDGRFVGAVVVVRVADGAIVAYALSSPVDSNVLDQLRGSGSTLKLIVDVAAASLGASADDGVIGGRNCAFPDGTNAPDSREQPILTIRDATAVSSNCAFGKLTRAIGPDRLADIVAALGFDRELDTSTRFGFGANVVSMRELALAAAIIVGGETAVVGLSKQDRPSSGASLAADVTLTVADMSSSVVTVGTAAGKQLKDRWAIAKTGTMAGSTDAWMFGGTPEFVAVAWLGNPRNPTDGMANGNLPGFESVHGGDLPAEVWRDALDAAHEGLPRSDLNVGEPTRSPVIVVDPTTDCLASPELVIFSTRVIDLPHLATGGPIPC